MDPERTKGIKSRL